MITRLCIGRAIRLSSCDSSSRKQEPFGKPILVGLHQEWSRRYMLSHERIAQTIAPLIDLLS